MSTAKHMFINLSSNVQRQPRTDYEDPPRERRQTVYKLVVIGGPAQGMSCSSPNLNYEMK